MTARAPKPKRRPPRDRFKPVTPAELTDEALTPGHVRLIQSTQAEILDLLRNDFRPQLIDIRKDQVEMKAEQARTTQAITSMGARVQLLEQSVAALSSNLRDVKRSLEVRIERLEADVADLKGKATP